MALVTSTLTQLQTTSLSKAKMLSGGFPETGELTNLINEAIRALWNRICASPNSFDIIGKSDVVTVAGAVGTLPADFLQLYSLRFPSTGTATEVRKLHPRDTGLVTPNGTSVTFAIDYIPVATNLVAPGDPIELPPDGDTYVSYSVAAMLLAEEESDNSAMEARAEQAVQRMLAVNTQKDRGQSFKVVDVYSNSRFNRGWVGNTLTQNNYFYRLQAGQTIAIYQGRNY